MINFWFLVHANSTAFWPLRSKKIKLFGGPKSLEILNCLGFVEGVACPHFDEEKEREPYVNDLLNRDLINSCICIEGYSALHIHNQNLMKTINFGDNKKCFKLFKQDSKIIKKFFL